MATSNCKTIRIVGTGLDIKVLDAETGKIIPGVQTLEFSADARNRHDAPFAKIRVIRPELDVTCDAHVESITTDDLPDNRGRRLTESFAEVTRKRMISAHERGKRGWQETNPALLLDALIKNLKQGDMVDVANYAMMLYQPPVS